MVLLGVLKFSEGYGPISMVSEGRFHHQFIPDEVEFEPFAIPVPLQKKLKKMVIALIR